jgi:hypothetical protein
MFFVMMWYRPNAPLDVGEAQWYRGALQRICNWFCFCLAIVRLTHPNTLTMQSFWGLRCPRRAWERCKKLRIYCYQDRNQRSALWQDLLRFRRVGCLGGLVCSGFSWSGRRTTHSHALSGSLVNALRPVVATRSVWVLPYLRSEWKRGRVW